MPEVLNKPRTTAEPSLKAPLPDVVFFGPFAFDRANGLLSRLGVELSLPPRAVGVLARLIDRAGDLVPKADLLDHVWKDTFVTEVSLTEAISLLRQTLGDDPQRPSYIQTQPRRGYRFVAALSDRPFDAPGATNAPAPDATPAAAEAPADDVWPGWLPWVVCGVLLFSLVAVSAGLLQQPGLRERQVARFDLNLDAAGITVTERGSPLAVSRDGTRIAFTGRRADVGSALFVRDLARLDAAALPGTEGARAPFFSPDGRWLGFFAKGRLFKVALAGGAPIALCDAPEAGGGVWTDTRTIVFGGRVGGLHRIGDTGGRIEVLTTPDVRAGEVRHAWPSLAASDRVVLFTGFGADRGPESARLAALSLDTGDVRTLVQGATYGRALDTGHLLFVRSGRIQAAPFDADVLAFQGAPVPVLDTVAVDTYGAAPFAVAAAGALVQVTTAERDDRIGAPWRWGEGPATLTAPFDSRAVRSIVADPAGLRAVAAVSDGHRSDVWTWALDRGASTEARRTRLTSEGHHLHPIWSADGAAIIYGVQFDGRFELIARAAAGSATGVRLAVDDRSLVPASLSRDGQLLYARADAAGGMDIWRLDVQQIDGRIAGGFNPQPLIEGRGDQTDAAISPDGHWLAWQSNASGAWRVLARDRGGSGAERDLGASFGGPLFWAEGAVAFQATDDTAAIVRVGADGAVDRAIVRNVIELAGFAPARGGLLSRGVEPMPPARLEVVLEWTKELSAKVPGQSSARPTRRARRTNWNQAVPQGVSAAPLRRKAS